MAYRRIKGTIEYINVPINTIPTAILVFGAHTFIGVGLPRLFGFGFGELEYILLFHNICREHLAFVLGRPASRRHGRREEDMINVEEEEDANCFWIVCTSTKTRTRL